MCQLAKLLSRYVPLCGQQVVICDAQLEPLPWFSCVALSETSANKLGWGLAPGGRCLICLRLPACQAPQVDGPP